MWRLLSGTAPTKAAILQKRVLLPDPWCVFCHIETLSMAMWALKLRGLRWSSNHFPSLLDWMKDWCVTLYRKQFDVLCMCLWAIWYERNSVLWNNGHFDPPNTIHRILTLSEEYHRLHPGKQKTKERRVIY